MRNLKEKLRRIKVISKYSGPLGNYFGICIRLEDWKGAIIEEGNMRGWERVYGKDTGGSLVCHLSRTLVADTFLHVTSNMYRWSMFPISGIIFKNPFATFMFSFENVFF
jgi:hypothetical protein